MIGTQIGNYKIKEFIASGGMSNVYLATNINDAREVAIKILKKSYTNDNEYIEKYFNREINITKSLDHPNIIRLLGYGKHDESYYIVYEFVLGSTLSKYISRNRPPVSQIEKIAESILNALSYAHSKGIIHRDVKPQNILVSTAGEIKITDFGISKAISSSTITNTGLFLGSPGYISPEQADPDILKGQEIDYRSDIYSFGILLFEMLTGRLPFISDTPWGIVNKHLKEEPPDVRQLDSSIPDYLSYIVMKCLKKDRNKRFNNANEIIQVLRSKNKPLASDFHIDIVYPNIDTSHYDYSASNAQTIYTNPNVAPVYLTPKSMDNYKSTKPADIYSNSIPVWKIVLFSIITLGLYNHYLYYRNWRYLREVLGIDIKPGLRTFGLFVPILSWILIYKQFKYIRNLVYNETVKSFSPGGMLAIYIAANILSGVSFYMPRYNILSYIIRLDLFRYTRLLDALLLCLPVMLYLIPLIIVQKNFNNYWGKTQTSLKLRHRLTVGEIMILGILFIYFVYALFIS